MHQVEPLFAALSVLLHLEVNAGLQPCPQSHADGLGVVVMVVHGSVSFSCVMSSMSLAALTISVKSVARCEANGCGTLIFG